MLLQSRPFTCVAAGRYSLLFSLPLVGILLWRMSVPAGLHGFAITKLVTNVTQGLLRVLSAKQSPYEVYQMREQEDAYWRNAEIGQLELASSDARFASGRLGDAWNNQEERQILYYTPRLLPEYRRERSKESSSDFVIPVKEFVKWHCLVFPDRYHPGPLQASRLLSRFSPSDFREMHRIAKQQRASRIALRGDEQDHKNTHGSRRKINIRPVQHTIAGKNPHNACRVRWRTWTQNREPELIIRFEETS